LDGLLSNSTFRVKQISPVEAGDEFVEIIIEIFVDGVSLEGAEHPSLHRASKPSRIEPVLEVNLEALEYLFFNFFNVFDVGELTPTSHIAVFRRALNLHDEFFYQPELVPVFFPKGLFANVRSLFLPVLGS
jgi:hypothetical protein